MIWFADHDSDTATVRGWKEDARAIIAKLRERGASDAWIASITLSPPGGDPSIPASAWSVSYGALAARKLYPDIHAPSGAREARHVFVSPLTRALLPDIHTFARLRYLVEHYNEDAFDDAAYREIAALVESQWKGAEVERLQPDAVIGGKVRSGGRQAHAQTHGTKEEKQARWQEMRQALEDAQRPGWSAKRVRQKVAKDKGWGERTLRRVQEKYFPKK